MCRKQLAKVCLNLSAHAIADLRACISLHDRHSWNSRATTSGFPRNSLKSVQSTGKLNVFKQFLLHAGEDHDSPGGP